MNAAGIASSPIVSCVWSGTPPRPTDGIGKLVQMLILTGQRRNEVSEATWTEFDLDNRSWVLPRARVKNDMEHEVPLSDQAVAIDQLPKIASKSKFIFTTTGETSISGFSRAKHRLDALVLAALQSITDHGEDPSGVEPLPHWTLHDLRRTAASGMARLGINLPVMKRFSITRPAASLASLKSAGGIHSRRKSGPRLIRGAGLSMVWSSPNPTKPSKGGDQCLPSGYYFRKRSKPHRHGRPDARRTDFSTILSEGKLSPKPTH